MWLHIRGVGEWTNTLYSYFEREKERLHNGEVMPYVPPNGSKSNTLESKAPLASHYTPQQDFLSRNITRLNHGPMTKASSLDNPRKIDKLQECPSEDGDTPAVMHNENETEKSDTNPFTFPSDDKNSARSPGSGQTSPKIIDEKTPASTTAKSRRTSDTTSPMKKIQATLQRTFSRKGSNPQDGYANDGFIADEGKSFPEKALSKSKAPLEKSLSMPDIANRMKQRKRLIA